MAGYSGKPLSEKLGIKQGYRVALVDAPDGIENLLDPLPKEIRFTPLLSGDIDIVILFSIEAQHLSSRIAAAIPQIKPAGMIWICWPKKSAKAKTDLNETIVRDTGLAAGVVDVKVCAIDDFWSGLKFVIRLKDQG